MVIHSLRRLSPAFAVVYAIGWLSPNFPSARAQAPAASTAPVGSAAPIESVAPVVIERAVAPDKVAPPGLVEWSNKQVPYADVPALLRKNKFYVEYESLRAQAPATPAGHWILAQFCGKHGLKEQLQAHLLAVIVAEPNHAGARAALNHKLIDGAWFSPAEQKAYHAEKVAAIEASRRWETPLKKIVAELKSKDFSRAMAAFDELRGVNDPGAIPHLEKIVSPTRNPQAGLGVVEAVRAMPGRAATMSLARHSAYHYDPGVRHAAAEALHARSQFDFVPAMLAELLTPVESTISVSSGLGGMVVMESFTREGADEQQQALVQVSVNVEPNSTAVAQQRALNRVQQGVRLRQLAAERENFRVKQVNERICSALVVATGESLNADPEMWWQWWNEKNELYQPEKSVRRRYSSEEITVKAPPPPATERGRSSQPSGGASTSASSGAATQSGGGSKRDCFAAGTEIVTTRGAVAIEALQVGDLVLAQDPQTGALAYKPVLATTIRPSGVLTRIKTSQGDYATSGGHPLFVAGRNWEKARNLQPGDRLRGLEATPEVVDVEEAGEALTYNIVVADFHNYFAGPAKILSHDNTLCEALIGR